MILNKIESELKKAIKERDEVKLATLRLLKTSLRRDKNAKQLTELEEVNILKRALKQRQDSAQMYMSANRKELADNELKEAKIIESYLPSQMTVYAMSELVTEVIIELKAESVKDMGRVMKEVLKRANGQADNKQVSMLVKKALNFVVEIGGLSDYNKQ